MTDTITREHLDTWRAEAEQKITVERQGNSGNYSVLIEGSKVAEFLCFGSIINSLHLPTGQRFIDTQEEAERLARDLRLAYVALASGKDFAYDRATVHYNDAQTAVCRTAERVVGATIRQHFPDAAAYTVHGEYGDEGEMRVRLSTILDAKGHVLYDVDEPTEEFEHVADEIDTDELLWLELEHDDWLGDHTIDIDP